MEKIVALGPDKMGITLIIDRAIRQAIAFERDRWREGARIALFEEGPTKAERRRRAKRAERYFSKRKRTPACPPHLRVARAAFVQAFRDSKYEPTFKSVGASIGLTVERTRQIYMTEKKRLRECTTA
jgi:DNA-directed RNA polymerase sigma subunit (sigma70/sigma32)